MAFATFLAMLDAERPAWQRDALCREYEDVTWFPGRSSSSAPAAAVCQRCLVAQECRAYAIDEDIGEGIWGGQSARSLLRARRRVRADAPGRSWTFRHRPCGSTDGWPSLGRVPCAWHPPAAPLPHPSSGPRDALPSLSCTRWRTPRRAWPS